MTIHGVASNGAAKKTSSQSDALSPTTIVKRVPSSSSERKAVEHTAIPGFLRDPHILHKSTRLCGKGICRLPAEGSRQNCAFIISKGIRVERWTTPVFTPFVITIHAH